MSLYRRIDLPSDEPVQFVGVYNLRWCGCQDATVAFVEAEDTTEQLQDDNGKLSVETKLRMLLESARHSRDTAVTALIAAVDERDALRAALRSEFCADCGGAWHKPDCQRRSGKGGVRWAACPTNSPLDRR